METIIRPAIDEDISEIYKMMRDFAEFERLGQYFRITEERLRDELFCKDAFTESIVALRGQSVIGYALFFPVFASFSGERRYFLEDLYVTSHARGTGAGRLLLREIARRALAKGFSGIEFHVLDWNRPAIDFYEKLGAECSTTDLNYKFTGKAFHSLAE